MAASLGIALELQGEEPLYQQLFDQIADRVRTRAWPTGYRLPPTRALADELGVHRNTVVRAFEELCAAGFLTSTVGRGTFVAPPLPAANSRRAPQAELPWQSLLSAAAVAEPLSRLDRFRRDGVPRGAINLSSLQPPPELLPDVALRRCIDHVLRSYGPRALGYAPSDGVIGLREQIARDLSASGVPALPEDILITTGSQQALDLVARALVNPGDRFLVDGITYTGALNLLTVAGANVVGVPNDGEGPDLDWLRRLSRGEVKGLYLMPNCHNPTGAVISAKRRQELVAWSHDVQAPLIEDDYGADLDLDGESVPPYLRALDSQVIYISTFSKKLIPGLRVGFIAAPAAFRERLAALKHALDLGTSALLQHALAEFLERGYHRAHFKRTLPEYRLRRDTLQAALERHLPEGVTWQRPKRGLTLWLRLPPALDPEEVYAHALRHGVVVSPGSLHAAQGRVHAGVRLSFCSEPQERLIQGAKRLGRALEELLTHQRDRHASDGRAAPVMHGV